jgi:glutamate racemase
MKNMKIGIFDSGFGGLTVLRGIRKELSDYDYIYLGDTARTPFGTRSQEVIYQFTEQAVDFLFKQGCEIIVLACNTASSEALRKIQQEYLPKNYPERRVLGVVIPTCEFAIESGYKKIGVMATNSTVTSESYVKEIKKMDRGAEILQQPCPLLVPIIESGEVHGNVLTAIIEDYLKPLKSVEAIILGCTHYEVIEDKIKEVAGGIKVISQSGVVGKKLSEYLIRHSEIEQRLSKRCSVKYFSTDITDRFKDFGQEIIGDEIEVQKVNLN